MDVSQDFTDSPRISEKGHFRSCNGLFSNRPVSMRSGATPQRNLANAARCLWGNSFWQYFSASKSVLNKAYVRSLLLPLPEGPTMHTFVPADPNFGLCFKTTISFNMIDVITNGMHSFEISVHLLLTMPH